MNTSFLGLPINLRLLSIVAVVLILAGLPGAPAASAADGIASAANLSPVLFAGLLQDVVGDRTRLIQVSFVIILVGIFILWKK